MTKPRPVWTDVILNGPTPGGGFFVSFWNGVSPGTKPPNCIARMNGNWPLGCLILIVILRVASSAVMPEMSSLALPSFWYLSAPTMLPVKKLEPPDSRLITRWIVCSKSLAFTGVPSEYFRPSRSVSV